MEASNSQAQPAGAPAGIKAVKLGGDVVTITPELANELLNTGVADHSIRYIGGEPVTVLELHAGVLEVSDDPVRDNEPRPRNYGIVQSPGQEG